MSSEDFEDSDIITPPQLLSQCYDLLGYFQDGDIHDGGDLGILKNDVEKTIVLLAFRGVVLEYLKLYMWEYPYDTDPEVYFNWDEHGFQVDGEEVYKDYSPSKDEVRERLRQVFGADWIKQASKICTEYDAWVLNKIKEGEASGGVMIPTDELSSNLPPKPNTVKRSKLK